MVQNESRRNLLFSIYLYIYIYRRQCVPKKESFQNFRPNRHRSVSFGGETVNHARAYTGRTRVGDQFGIVNAIITSTFPSPPSLLTVYTHIYIHILKKHIYIAHSRPAERCNRCARARACFFIPISVSFFYARAMAQSARV